MFPKHKETQSTQVFCYAKKMLKVIHNANRCTVCFVFLIPGSFSVLNVRSQKMKPFKPVT